MHLNLGASAPDGSLGGTGTCRTPSTTASSSRRSGVPRAMPAGPRIGVVLMSLGRKRRNDSSRLTTSSSSARPGVQFAERSRRVPPLAMDADELLARSLQEEEDRAAAAELLRRDASASAVSSQRARISRGDSTEACAPCSRTRTRRRAPRRSP